MRDCLCKRMNGSSLSFLSLSLVFSLSLYRPLSLSLSLYRPLVIHTNGFIGIGHVRILLHLYMKTK